MGNGHFGIVVIGAGPRGTSLLERLAARLEGDRMDAHPRQLLDITVVDPHEPGPGHVWATGQLRLFLMNTPALFPTVAPPRGNGAGPGLTFGEWLAAGGDGAALTPPEASNWRPWAPAPTLAGPVRALPAPRPRTGCRPRLAVHPAVAQLRHLPARRRCPCAAPVPATRSGSTAGTTLPADAVVLALGHVPAALNPEQQQLQERPRGTACTTWRPTCRPTWTGAACRPGAPCWSAEWA